MGEDDGNVRQKANHRESKQPGEAVTNMAATSAHFEPSAEHNQAGREGDNPELVRVQQVVKFYKRIREYSPSGGCPGERRGQHGQGRQPTAHGVHAHHRRVGKVRSARAADVML